MTDKNSETDTDSTGVLYQNGCRCGNEWKSHGQPDECPNCGNQMSETNTDTIDDFAANDSQIHQLELPSQTVELTTEDIVWLKEFFAELEVVDAQEE